MEVHRVSSIDSIDLVDFLVEENGRASIAPAAGIEEESLVSEFKQMELRGELKPEPLLMEDKQRFVLFPIKHTDVSLDPKAFRWSHARLSYQRSPEFRMSSDTMTYT
jgi:hypothetical protein